MSDSVTANYGGLAKSASFVALPDSAPTAANQATEIASLADIDGKLPASLGAKAGAASLSVVPASDGFTVTLAASTTEPDGTKVVQIDTTKSKFADNFSGAAYAAGAASLTALGTNWTVVRQTLVGMTVTLNNGSLAVNMGTTNGDELLLIGKNIATIPANLIATFLMSQRIANNEVRFGYCEVDAAGALVANPNLANFPNNMAAALLDGTAAATGKLETIVNGVAAQKAQTLSGMTSTAAVVDYALECRPEDVMLTSRTGDSAVAGSSAPGRLSSVVPDPGKRYAPFIWLRNTGAPGSATTVTIDRIYSADIQEIQVEATGRGGNGSSQGVPVNIVGPSAGTQVAIAHTGTSSMSGSQNNNSFHKLISAATTNATSVKGSLGRIHGGMLSNLTASVKYVKFYNKASAPTVGTDTPVITAVLQPNANVMVAALFAEFWGAHFSSGIAYAITGAAADADTTAVAAGDVIVNLQYV